jgi:DNA-binding MarR family transcriptional regulator
MGKLRRSPFKVNRIENDPNAFGLRVKETVVCAEALFNDLSILISGPRGIGKSSLGSQLQRILEGDSTLLKRCGIDTMLPKHLCLFYACDQENTLNQLALNILYGVEQKCLLLPQTQSAELKPSLEINLGVVKAKLEAETSLSKRSPATIATQLVTGLSEALRTLRKLREYDGINIMLDELDQLSPQINFGHFMKILHETLVRENLQRISFVFAGQQGIYTRFVREDPSFERIVRHVPLSTLDGDASNYVLEYAASHASPPFQIEARGKTFILSLSSGYPYVLHLLGNAAFLAMADELTMTHRDVMNGIEAVLKSDKREKYLSRLKDLSEAERQAIIVLSEYPVRSIPAEIPIVWMKDIMEGYLPSEDSLDTILDSLEQKGHIRMRKDRTHCIFAEELFRVFVSLASIEQHELQIARAEKVAKEEARKRKDEKLLDALRSGKLDLQEDLSGEEREEIIERICRILDESEYTTDWEEDDLFDIYERYDRLSEDITDWEDNDFFT